MHASFIRDPSVAVEVDTYRPFFVLGEVTYPGQYPYVPNMTVENAIAIAGGFTPRAVKDKVTVSDADAMAYYDGHKESYRKGEQRKLKYLLIDAQQIRSGITVSAQDVQTYYDANKAQFAVPEQLDAIFVANNYRNLHVPEFAYRKGQMINVKGIAAAMLRTTKNGGTLTIIDDAAKPGTGFTQVATLGRVDEDAVKLLREWIQQLPEPKP